MPERGAESTQDDLLDFVFLPDRKDEQDEEFEGNGLKR